MKRHFQCAEQAKSPSNLTKYCACHEILRSTFQRRIPELLPPIERRFDDNPSIIRTWNRHLAPAASGTFPVRSWRRFCINCKMQHFASRLSPKMSRSAAPVTKSHPPTSPNTAPATQNQCHQWSASHMKRHFQCMEQVKSVPNLTKYCTCHAKWMSLMICVTYETSFPMRGANTVSIQPHQMLRLPRKMNVTSDLRHIWNVISNARSKQSHPPTSPNTAPATKFWGQHFNGESLNCFRQ